MMVQPLTDSQIVVLEQYCMGQLEEETLLQHLPKITADTWVDLAEHLEAADLENAFQTFIMVAQLRRMSFIADAEQAEEDLDDDNPFFRP